MYPKAFASAQATLRAQGTIILVVCIAASLFVGVEALGPHGGSAGKYLYNVSYQNATDSMGGPTGTAPLRTTTDVTVVLVYSNLTNVTFTISWMDQTISPFFNPAVSATITGPNGTGSTTNRVATTGTAFSIPITNSMPANATVEAGSEEEALATAGADNNATLGSGSWTVSLDVGSPLGPRPGGSISYSIEIEVEYFMGTAVRA